MNVERTCRPVLSPSQHFAQWHELGRYRKQAGRSHQSMALVKPPHHLGITGAIIRRDASSMLMHADNDAPSGFSHTDRLVLRLAATPD